MSPVLEAAVLIGSVTALFAVLGGVLYGAYSLGWSAAIGKAAGQIAVLERELVELRGRNEILEREADGVANAGQAVVDRAAAGRAAPDGPDGDSLLLGGGAAASGGGTTAPPSAAA